MNALIIVDIQNDFLPGGALAVPDGDTIIPVVNGLMERHDLVVATQDWHPAEHGSFAENHEGAEPGMVISMDWIRFCGQCTVCRQAPGRNSPMAWRPQNLTQYSRKARILESIPTVDFSTMESASRPGWLTGCGSEMWTRSRSWAWRQTIACDSRQRMRRRKGFAQ